MTEYSIDVACLPCARGSAPREEVFLWTRLPRVLRGLLLRGTIAVPDMLDSDEDRMRLLREEIRRIGTTDGVRIQFYAAGAEVSPYTGRVTNARDATVFEFESDEDCVDHCDDQRLGRVRYLVVVRRERANDGRMSSSADAPPARSARFAADLVTAADHD